MVRYIGIDPSTKTGLVIMGEDGTVLLQEEITSSIDRDPERFTDLADKTTWLIQEGDKVFIEGFSFGSKGQGVSTQYGIGWLLRERLVSFENMLIIPRYIEVPPTTLKKFATGKGNVKKEDMILPINDRWGFRNSSDNIRDAYVLCQIGRALDGLGEPTKAQMDCIKGLTK